MPGIYLPTEPQDVWRILEVKEVVDGDTYRLRVDQRYGDIKLIEARLNPWDTPEKQSSATRKVSAFEKSEAQRATIEANEWFHVAKSFKMWIHTEPDTERWGRWLGEIWYERPHFDWPGQVERHSLGGYLAGLDLATAYPTRWYQVFDK
jgi:endonuclease YncB( thermonuclease family)